MHFPHDVELVAQYCLTAAAAWVGAFAALLIAARAAAQAPRSLVRQNFRGLPVPVIGGLAVLIVGCVGGGWIALNAIAGPDTPAALQAAAVVLALAGFGILGLADDLFGDRSVGGYRGHLRRLLRGGTVTTGVVKAVGGALIGLAAGWLVARSITAPLPGRHAAVAIAGLTLLYGAFTALAANTANLLDLRPGRCLTACLPAVVVGAATAAARSDQPLLALAGLLTGIVLALLPPDRRGRIMLGDAGANALGAAAAIVLAAAAPWPAVAVAVVALAAFQVWSETHSLSRFIDGQPLLRRLDRKIGVR